MSYIVLTAAYSSFMDIFTYLVSLRKVIRIFKKYIPVSAKVTFLLLLLVFILLFHAIVLPQMAKALGLSVHICE